MEKNYKEAKRRQAVASRRKSAPSSLPPWIPPSNPPPFGHRSYPTPYPNPYSNQAHYSYPSFSQPPLPSSFSQVGVPEWIRKEAEADAAAAASYLLPHSNNENEINRQVQYASAIGSTEHDEGIAKGTLFDEDVPSLALSDLTNIVHDSKPPPPLTKQENKKKKKNRLSSSGQRREKREKEKSTMQYCMPTNNGSPPPQSIAIDMENPPTSISDSGIPMTKRNQSKKAIQFYCKYKRSNGCGRQCWINAQGDMRSSGEHKQECYFKAGQPIPGEDALPKVGNDHSGDMKMRTIEEAEDVSQNPMDIWEKVNKEFLKKYGKNYIGMRKDQVINLVNNHRRQKIGGDALQKVEGEYCGSTKDAFCRHSSLFCDENGVQRQMAFSRPELCSQLGYSGVSYVCLGVYYILSN